MTHNVIRIYHKSCWRQLSYCGLHVRAVSVFGKKSDAVCGFLAYFCAVLRFSDPPYAPLLKLLYHPHKVMIKVDWRGVCTSLKWIVNNSAAAEPHPVIGNSFSSLFFLFLFFFWDYRTQITCLLVPNYVYELSDVAFDGQHLNQRKKTTWINFLNYKIPPSGFRDESNSSQHLYLKVFVPLS